MKKVLLFLTSIFFVSNLCFGQGLNNNYQLDEEDLKNVFKMQGIDVFKFPFQLEKGEYISLSYCIYKNGIEIERCDLIEDIQIEAGIAFNHHLSFRDTTSFHRIYFMNQSDSILNIRVVVPGISIYKKIDIANIVLSDCTASLNINYKLPVKTDILSYYALFNDSEKLVKYDGSLPCASGLSKEKIISRYDFVLIFFAERITKERVKTILEEDIYKRKKK